MDITDFETTAKVLVGIAVLVNLSELVHPQCIGFGSSIDVREMYLHEHSESAIAFKAAKLLLFNIGCYNLCVCIVAISGLLLEDMDLCLVAMVVFAVNSVCRVATPAEGVAATTIHSVPPLTVMFFYFAGHVAPAKKELPFIASELELVVMLPAAMHALFFITESVLFPYVKLIQKLFIGGKATANHAALSVSKGLMFQQGVFNLNLAGMTYYGFYYLQSTRVVVAMLLVYVGAAIALMYSAPPKQAVGGIAQGGPPLYALYLISHL